MSAPSTGTATTTTAPASSSSSSRLLATQQQQQRQTRTNPSRASRTATRSLYPGQTLYGVGGNDSSYYGYTAAAAGAGANGNGPSAGANGTMTAIAGNGSGGGSGSAVTSGQGPTSLIAVSGGDGDGAVAATATGDMINGVPLPGPGQTPYAMYPAITHFTDAVTALPREFQRHASLLKEVDSKAWRLEEMLSQQLDGAAKSTPFAAVVGDYLDMSFSRLELNRKPPNQHNHHHHLHPNPNGATTTTTTTASRRKLFSDLHATLTELMVTADEKNHVLWNANNELSKHVYRLETVYQYVQGEVSEDTRLGRKDHWAYWRKPEKPTRTSDRPRRETTHATETGKETGGSSARRRRNNKERHEDDDHAKGARRNGSHPSAPASKRRRVDKSEKSGTAAAAAATTTSSSHPISAAMEHAASSNTTVTNTIAHTGRNTTTSKDADGSAAATTTGAGATGTTGSKPRRRTTAGTGSRRRNNNNANSTAAAATAAGAGAGAGTGGTVSAQGSPMPTVASPAGHYSTASPMAASVRGAGSRAGAGGGAGSGRSRPSPAASSARANGTGRGSMARDEPAYESKYSESNLKREDIQNLSIETTNDTHTYSRARSSKTSTPVTAEAQMTSTTTGRATRNHNGNGRRGASSTGGKKSTSNSHAAQDDESEREQRDNRSGDYAPSRPQRSNAQGRNATGNTTDRDSQYHQHTTQQQRHIQQALIEDTEMMDDESESEPRYCYCNQVSYGEMVACDKEDCEREWFHLSCVGLSKPPGKSAKWYCNECKEKMRKPKSSGR